MKQVIYSKFSNERNRHFAIRTDILEDESGNRCVRKVCAYPEGQLHVAQICRWYQLFSEFCAGTKLSYNRCRMITGGVELEYIEGKTLEEYLQEVEKSEGTEAMLAVFREYLGRIRRLHEVGKFEETAGFREVFGDFCGDLQRLDLMCAPATNIDLICENILLAGEEGTVIDYEWSFDFPIPVNYLLYRNIFYLTEHAGREYLHLYDLCAEAGISEEEIAAYRRMEEHFQRYVCRDHVPVRDLYDTISPGVIGLTSVRRPEFVQLYFDGGRGYREKDSVKFQAEAGRAKGTVSLRAGLSRVRLDPGPSACFVEIETLTVDGQDVTDQLELSGGIRQGNILCFDKADPFMVLPKVPEGARELAFSMQIWLEEEEPMHRMAECIWQLEMHGQVLREMKNTKVWKVYQKYRDLVERKHE